MYPAGALFLFSFTQLGLLFHPVGASFRFFLPVSLAVLPPPFWTTQHRASSESPPEVRLWDSNRSPFGFVLTNPTPKPKPKRLSLSLSLNPFRSTEK